jgi:hypothetical protein
VLTDTGATSCNTASYLGHLDIVKIILKANTGIDVNELNKEFSVTPLEMVMLYMYKVLNQEYEAVEGDRIQIMRLLYRAGGMATEENAVFWYQLGRKAKRFWLYL